MGAVTAFASCFSTGTKKTHSINSIPQGWKESRAVQLFPFPHWQSIALHGLDQGHSEFSVGVHVLLVLCVHTHACLVGQMNTATNSWGEIYHQFKGEEDRVPCLFHLVA